MANQEITVIGNIGTNPTFKSGDYEICEIFLLTEEYTRNQQGQMETRKNSQAAYQVTVWGNKDNPALLDPLKNLKKGMRIEVKGQFRAGLFTNDNGDTQLSLNISTNPSGVSLKLNRIESITMAAPRGNQQGQAPAQNQNDSSQYDPSLEMPEWDVPY